MDSLSDPDFVDIFDRVTGYIDVEACKTPEDIEWEMMAAIAIMRRGVRKAKRASTRKKWGGRIKLLGILGTDGIPAISEKLRGKIRMGFAYRVIQFAEAHPRSRVALTLQYGKEKAKKILRERLQKRLRALAKRK